MTDIRSSVLRTCHALFRPDQVTELRILGIQSGRGYTHNASGWFDNHEQLANAVHLFDQKNPNGIYVTINDLHPACLARTNNHIVERRKDTTSDRDVIRRHFLPIDLDPVRPSGISSTADELKHALEQSHAIKEYLIRTHGFPLPLVAHSGNGIHLLFRIDLGNTNAARDLIQKCLVTLSERFTSDRTAVDTTLYNASRILKLWGTVTRKGEHTHNRPHRRSKLWDLADAVPIFGNLVVVPEDQLKALSLATKDRPAVVVAKKTVTQKRQANDVDLEAWVKTHNLGVKRIEPFDTTGIRIVLNACLFDSSHTGTSAILGKAPSGAVFYKCQHESCKDKKWSDVREKIEGKKPKKKKKKAKQGDADPNSPWGLASAFLTEEFEDLGTGKITLRRHREQFYAYEERQHVYRPMSQDAMRTHVTRWLADRVERLTTRCSSDMMSCLSAMVTLPEEIEMPFYSKIHFETKCAQGKPDRLNWITLQNGIFDLSGAMKGRPIKECLMNHSPEWFNSIGLHYPFPTTEKATEHPTWTRFLQEVLECDDDRIALIQEMFGYCFMCSTEMERFFILHGPGSNGKSTALDVLTELLGDENVSSLSMDQLSDPRLRYEVCQKLANICSDMPEMDRIEEGVLKRITSGEAIVADRKYKDAIKFRPTAKCIFSTNTLPRFNDVSMGIWRRMIVMPFNYVIPDEHVDVHLLDKLRKELPAILLWALEGAVRLRRQMRFTESEICAEAHRQYRMQCFPIYMYLTECCAQENCCQIRDLWRTYKKWAHANGLTRCKSLHHFVQDVLSFWPKTRIPRVQSGMLAGVTMHGIRLRLDLDLEDPTTTMYGDPK